MRNPLSTRALAFCHLKLIKKKFLFWSKYLEIIYCNPEVKRMDKRVHTSGY